MKTRGRPIYSGTIDIKKIPIIFLIFFLIFGSIIQFEGISSFHQFPSPIYGGDYYYQMGSVNHIRYGGNPFESSSMEGGIPGYFPLYGILCAGFCNIFGFDTLHGMLYFSIVVFVMACIVWFYLFKTLFNNNWIALIGVLLANGNLMPILKYTPFTSQIMVPLFILSLYMVFKERKTKYYILLGILYGLFAISHMVAFIGSTLILSIFFIYQLFEAYNTNNIHKHKNLKNTFLRELIKKWGLLGLISAPLLLLYWYKPLFVYRLKMGYYDRVHMDTPDFARFDVQINFLIDTVKRYLLNFNTFESGIKSVLALFGIFGYLKSENTVLKKFFAIFLTGSLFATFSYFITEPLLHINFIPTYMSGFYIAPCMVIFSLFGLSYFGRFMKDKGIILYALLFLILFTNSLYTYDDYLQNNKWANVGRYYLPPQYIELEKYLINNSDLNDVILSTKELSFAVNSISGRKVIVDRWAQTANPYENMPKRDMDAAIILYGNDTKEKLRLIKKYNVKYIYWDKYWTNSEFKINNTTSKIISKFDPLITLDTSENRKRLNKYNVSYYSEHTWMDPACVGEHIRKFDILVISPKNYYNDTNPWKPDLNQYLEEVWNYSENGQKIAVLYKVKVYGDE